MGILISALAATTFAESIVLVLVSATATGVFGLLIVIIQVRSERQLHARINELEGKADTVVTTTASIDERTTTIAENVKPANGEPTP